MRVMALVVCFLAIVATPTLAAPSIEVYSSLGPDDSYSTDGSVDVTGSGTGYYGALACGFTVSTGTYPLARIEMALVYDGFASNSVVVSLRNDNAGVPGSVLESFTLPDVVQEYPGSIVSMESTAQPLLQNGSSYWVVLEPGVDDTWVGWCSCDPVVEGRVASSDGTSWIPDDYYVQAYRVTAAVPEPATLSLLGLGLAGLVLGRKRR